MAMPSHILLNIKLLLFVENDYNEYLQQKELQAQIRDEEKRKV